ncbi:Antibiotic biosynthesis monooxygenase [Rippkaea orientalis PCC 8801]|uniref:Antibiotic biosynthesis monooxygenase n=1 Tax=Rippkaea orientalis (strain PCC 8801 / RF-1) TaxID=41431 RepID=B7JW46_RIPO1|nr:antibiotic biosynthesis monooxygenase [Rippkaea orientalis]ACK65735.1 Antibiotic biosynthesis monooxygenase [Rippkaea orientalis PCC 8801]
MPSSTGIVAITRHVKPGSEVAFEEAVKGVILAASTFPGYIGGEVLYPQTKRGAWQLILRFETPVHREQWEKSPICQGWIARADALTIGPPNVVRVNGLEAWFTLPEVGNTLPPPKWKTAIVSAIGIYPVISVVPMLLKPITGGLPPWLATLVTIAIIMPLMTWVIMPQITRLFQQWLYPSPLKNSVHPSSHSKL